MSLEKEARELLREVEDPARRITSKTGLDINELRSAIREGVFEFEELLKTLATKQRKAVYTLYLQKIRRTTCLVHMVADLIDQKNETGGIVSDNDPPDTDLLPATAFIAHLYRY